MRFAESGHALLEETTVRLYGVDRIGNTLLLTGSVSIFRHALVPVEVQRTEKRMYCESKRSMLKNRNEHTICIQTLVNYHELNKLALRRLKSAKQKW